MAAKLPPPQIIDVPLAALTTIFFVFTDFLLNLLLSTQFRFLLF